MMITKAKWTPKANILTIACDCGRSFEHRADRRTVRCRCGKIEDLFQIREKQYGEENHPDLAVPD